VRERAGGFVEKGRKQKTDTLSRDELSLWSKSDDAKEGKG